MKLNNEELLNVVGGVSASMVTAILKVITSVVDFGRKFGSAIRRAISHSPCKL